MEDRGKEKQAERTIEVSVTLSPDDVLRTARKRLHEGDLKFERESPDSVSFVIKKERYDWQNIVLLIVFLFIFLPLGIGYFIYLAIRKAGTIGRLNVSATEEQGKTAVKIAASGTKELDQVAERFAALLSSSSSEKAFDDGKKAKSQAAEVSAGVGKSALIGAGGGVTTSGSDRTYAERYKSARGIATLLVIAFGLVILVDVIAAVIDIQRINLLRRIISGGHFTLEEAEASDSAFSTVGIFLLIAFIVTAVVFLIWIYCAYKNLEPLGSRNRQYSPAWAVGGFFIPFVNYVLPFLITKEIWKASDPKLNDGQSWRGVSVSPLVPAWWVLYVVSNIAGYIVGRVVLSGAETFTDLLNQSWAWLIADVLQIPAAVLGVLVVWGIASRQDEKNRNLMSVVPVLG
jgi:uncharacterized protein YunC (DUF1805 family)